MQESFTKPNKLASSPNSNNKANNSKFNPFKFRTKKTKTKSFTKSSQTRKNNTNNSKENIVSSKKTYQKFLHYSENDIPDIIKPSLPDRVILEALENNQENLLTALYDAITEKLVTFDRAVELIRQRENLNSEETLLYAGKGTFAIIAFDTESGNQNKQIVKRKIEFEKPNQVSEWRLNLRYELTMSYTPNPRPLSELYSQEDISKFPLNNK